MLWPSIQNQKLSFSVFSKVISSIKHLISIFRKGHCAQYFEKKNICPLSSSSFNMA